MIPTTNSTFKAFQKFRDQHPDDCLGKLKMEKHCQRIMIRKIDTLEETIIKAIIAKKLVDKGNQLYGDVTINKKIVPLYDLDDKKEVYPDRLITPEIANLLKQLEILL